MNFHALLGKLFKVSSVLHLRVILDCLLLHFSFCFPSCFSYYAPLANSELTVNLSFFFWRIELKHLRKAELPGRTPAANTCVAWLDERSQQMGTFVEQGGWRAEPAVRLAHATIRYSLNSSLLLCSTVTCRALCFSSQKQMASRSVRRLQLCLHGTAVEL